MKGEQEVAAMRAAGPPRRYSASLPLLTLVKELGRHKSVRYVSIRSGTDSLTVGGGTAA